MCLKCVYKMQISYINNNFGLKVQLVQRFVSSKRHLEY